MELSEWHTGYRAYSVAALRDIPFDGNSDGFDFDTQIIMQLHEAGKRIVEVPIPTYYGDEISYVNGMQYAYDIVRHVLRYRAAQDGLRDAASPRSRAPRTSSRRARPRRTAGCSPGSRPRQPARVLDLGCSDGKLAEALRVHGHQVTGVDRDELPGVERPGRRASSPPTSTPASPTRWATASTSCSRPTCSSTCATPSSSWPRPGPCSRRAAR